MPRYTELVPWAMGLKLDGDWVPAALEWVMAAEASGAVADSAGEDFRDIILPRLFLKKKKQEFSRKKPQF